MHVYLNFKYYNLCNLAQLITFPTEYINMTLKTKEKLQEYNVSYDAYQRECGVNRNAIHIQSCREYRNNVKWNFIVRVDINFNLYNCVIRHCNVKLRYCI